MVKLTPPAIKSHICHHSKSLTATVYLIPSTLSQKSHRSRLTRCEYLRNLYYIRMEVCTLRSARVDPIGFFYCYYYFVLLFFHFFLADIYAIQLSERLELPFAEFKKSDIVAECFCGMSVSMYVCMYVIRVSLQNIFSLRLSTSTRTRQ